MKLYLFLATFVALNHVLAAEEDIEDLFEQLFTTVGKPENPGRTMMILKRILKIREENPDPEKSGSAQEALVRNLITLSELKTCEKGNLMRMNFCIGSNPFFLNVVAFVKHYRGNLFRQCDKKMEQDFLNEVYNIDSNVRMSITLLRDKVNYANGDFSNEMPFYSRTALIQGLIAYLQSRPSDVAQKMLKYEPISNREFQEFVRATLIDTCDELSHDFITLANIYLGILHDNQLRSRVDSFILYWVINNQICRDILDDEKAITDEIYVTLKTKKPAGFFERFYKDPRYIIKLLNPEQMP